MKQHLFKPGDDIVIVKDLSGTAGEMVGCEAQVKELLPMVAKHPQYKVLIFGVGKVIGGIFEVDERELGRRIPE